MKIDIQNEFESMTTHVASDDFFKGEGLGNELAFYIYDYDPRYEVEVRKQIPQFIKQVTKKTSKQILHIDMLELIVEVLKSKGLLEKSYELQAKLGNDGFLEAIKGVINEATLSDIISEKCVGKFDLLIVSGIGKSYPISRAHNLLNNLHAKMRNTPLIMLYPGLYNKQSLHLFNEFKDDNYYRAFRLIDRQE